MPPGRDLEESILDHFNARNRAEAVAVAFRLKLVD